MFRKIIVGGFALYGLGVATSKLSMSYLEKNGKRLAMNAAAKIIDYLFDEYEIKDHDGNDIFLETKHDAIIVYSELRQILKDYGCVSLADYYDLLGLRCNWSDNKYGWKSLDGSKILRNKDNTYSIVMPKMRKLD